MIELALGVLAGLLIAQRAGWPLAVGAFVGVPIGAVIYFASCLYWDSVRCWWPWCTARKQTKAGPGKRVRRRWKCRVCGGSGLRPRWGARWMDRD